MASALVGLVPRNWQLQAETILTANANTIEVLNIPPNFKFLYVFISAAMDNAVSSPSPAVITLNGDTGNSYNYQYIQASGNAVTSASAVNQTSIPIGQIQDYADGFNLIQMVIAHIPELEPRGFNIYGGSFEIVRTTSGYFDKTDEITQITLTPTTPPLRAGSRISVYGVV